MFEWSVFAVVFFVLSMASVQDIRRREVSDEFWMVICILAVVTSLVSTEGCMGIVRASAVMAVSLYMFSPRVKGMISVAVIVLAVCMLAFVSSVTSDAGPAISAVMAVSVILLYIFGVIRGGADAKALVSLSLLFPLFPSIGGMLWPPMYPEDMVFNPVFSALVISLLISLIWTAIAIRKLGDGEGCRLGQCMMPIRKARESFVWPMEDVMDGRKVGISATDDVDRIYEHLECAGYDSVRVTPMIPFIPMITAGFTVVILMGTPLNLLIF